MGWLEKQVRRIALKHILLATAVIVATTAYLASEWRYFQNYFAGPVAMSANEIVAVKNANAPERYWITAKPDEIIDTGVDHITETRRRRGGTSRSVTGHYWVFRFGDRLMFAKAESEVKPEGTVEGYFIQPTRDLLRPDTSAAVRARFLPVMLDTTSFADWGNWALTIGGVLGLGGLAVIGRAFRQWSAPTRHPAVAEMLKAPGFSLADAGQSIAADLAAKNVMTAKGHQLTSRFYAKTGGLTFDAKPLDDLLWAYQQTTKKKIYGFIPAGSIHAAVLNFTDKTVTVPLKKNTVEPYLSFLVKQAPWAIYDYNDGLASAFKSQKREFVAHIAERKTQWVAYLAEQQAQQGQQQQA